MQALVLAAGLGTRLWPLTEDRAKPAVPFLGTPLIRHTVARLFDSGVERVTVNTHHRPESIRAALAGLPVAFSHEPEILGTAGAIAQALHGGMLDPHDPVLVVNGKLYTEIDFREIVNRHRNAQAPVTMVLRQNKSRARFREVLLEGNFVVGFGEGRQPRGPRPVVFTGIHILEPEVTKTIPRTFCDTVQDVYPELIEARRVHGLLVNKGRWWEFSTLERYLGYHIRAHAEGFAPGVWTSADAKIHPTSRVHHAVLWESAEVDAGARVERAVLGPGVRIERQAVVEDAVVIRRAGVGAVDDGRALRILGDHLEVPLDPNLVKVS